MEEEELLQYEKVLKKRGELRGFSELAGQDLFDTRFQEILSYLEVSVIPIQELLNITGKTRKELMSDIFSVFNKLYVKGNTFVGFRNPEYISDSYHYNIFSNNFLSLTKNREYDDPEFLTNDEVLVLASKYPPEIELRILKKCEELHIKNLENLKKIRKKNRIKELALPWQWITIFGMCFLGYYNYIPFTIVFIFYCLFIIYSFILKVSEKVDNIEKDVSMICFKHAKLERYIDKYIVDIRRALFSKPEERESILDHNKLEDESPNTTYTKEDRVKHELYLKNNKSYGGYRRDGELY
ncbi:hypothetical protein B488_04830 [Liberibacter crescens BT-1]|uniref:Uncharacterized protein n=1 Tax=Liberibacter crescens (strain BT-1) TaxID=1215343 RepID=L0EUF0_LIBCB|nr:hypothetical protein [Liberibacter crescens]AGA64475.1 hypothetical protein B488_04830 [Liberibacter crescens BT-1]AMC12643.1 hypothetical protein RL73_02525 [Liberibacter crescens]